jgi:phosphoribosylanthranilate isomerase
MVQLKICGLRDAANILAVDALEVMMLGFIFYPLSKRYTGIDFVFPAGIRAKKTGVFVDAPLNEIQAIVEQHSLEAVQLHGQESPRLCAALKNDNLQIIKAFAIHQGFNFDQVLPYMDATDLFLFDTASPFKGGSGQKFNWELLDQYNFDKPFLLSGGIGPEDAVKIRSMAHPMLLGIDLNSRFEDQPALKNISLLKKFINELNYAK